MTCTETARRPAACHRAPGVVARLAGTLILGAAVQAPSAQQPENAGRLDTADVEAFVDALMHEAMPLTYAPGVIVTVVEGERLVLAKGYGFADVETRAAIDPERTLFRIASITKVFTTVAALRLAERGRLDLDRDVNDYLTRVRVPDTFSEPVTARLLMTHRGGFDTAVGYMDFPTEQAARQTPEQMQLDIRRARPVSALPMYDNMGFGVLGLVVADVLKSSYADAMRAEVFSPLQMTQSVVGLPADRVSDAAQAHMRDAHWRAVRIPQNVMPTSAQGGGDISTTAVDMGKFMSALLPPGGILQPATLAQMTDFDTWRFHPRLPGLGLGLWQYDYRGHPAEGHRGEVNGFISRMALFRDQGIGIFVSVNSTVQPWPQPRLSYVLAHRSGPMPPEGARTLDPDTLIEGLIARFADRYVPPVPFAAGPQPRVAGEVTASRLAGSYFRLDASTHLMERVMRTLRAPRAVALPGEQLAIVGMCGPFVRRGPLLYECRPTDNDSARLGFRVTESGTVFAGVNPVDAYEQQPWWRTAPFAVLPVPILVLLGLSAFWARRHARTPGRRRVFGLAALGSGLFLAALLLELQFAYDLAHSTLHWLPVLWRPLFPVAALALLASAGLAMPALRPQGGNGRTAYEALSAGYCLALALGSLLLVWLIWLWGLAWPFH